MSDEFIQESCEALTRLRQQVDSMSDRDARARLATLCRTVAEQFECAPPGYEVSDLIAVAEELNQLAVKVGFWPVITPDVSRKGNIETHLVSIAPPYSGSPLVIKLGEVNRKTHKGKRDKVPAMQKMFAAQRLRLWASCENRPAVNTPRPQIINGEVSRRLQLTATSDEAETAELPPALTKAERLTLKVLADISAETLSSVADIEQSMDISERISVRQIGPALNRLIDYGFAERPQGDRHGARATLPGRKLWKKIAD